MPDELFFEENVSITPSPSRNDGVTDERCCLCGDQLGSELITEQMFEVDSTGRVYRAHVTCAGIYATLLRAIRRALVVNTPHN